MTTTTYDLRIGSLNVNQFSTPDHQRLDIIARMKELDILFLQECLDLDVVTFAKAHGWIGVQTRNGDNDGHANTAVIYRPKVRDMLGDVVGPPAVVDLGKAPHIPGHPHTGSRERYLIAVEFACGEWFGTFHVFREADKSAIPHQMAVVGGWVKGKRVTLGLDRNQEPVAALERITGLKWHGVKIDGFLTHLPTTAVQEFRPGYSDHPGVHATMRVTVHHDKPKGHHVVKPPNPTHIGPPAHLSAGHNLPAKRIGLHSTVGPCKPGAARQIAAYFMSEAAGGSAQYIVDPAEVIQSAWDDQIAWGAPGAAWSRTSHPSPANIHSLHIEMCDTPGPVPNDPPGSARRKALKRSWRWILPNQQRMLKRTAKLTAHLCAAYDIPLVFLTVEDLLAGKDGVTTHANISAAFHQTTHWDPGWWPQRRFMRLARAEYKRLTGTAAAA